MGGKRRNNPSKEEVTTWLKQLEPGMLNRSGWLKTVRRFPGLTDAIQPYIQQHFTNEAEQRAVYDGLILALVTLAHFEDIERLNELFTQPSVVEQKLTTPDVESGAA
jgi:hypothetical protein